MKNVPWRMILILALLVFVALFSGFNLNPVDISIGFYVFKGIPLFLALIAAFIAGALLMVPFTVLKRKSKKLPSTQTADDSNMSRRSRRKKEKAQEATTPPETVSEE